VEEGLSHGGYFSTLGVARWASMLDRSTGQVSQPAGELTTAT
jgi:hypothetical protein